MLIFIAVAGLVIFGLFSWFFTLESRDERHVIFVVLVMTLLVEGLLAGPAAEVPVGILRPRVAGQDFRPPDAVIVAALAARLLSIRSQHFSRVSIWWTAFIAMYVTGVGIGLLHGLPSQEVLFQGKGAFYLVGGMVIASGADLRRVSSSVWKLGLVLAAMVPIALVVDAINLDVSLSTPIQRLNRLGRLSNDTVTLVTLAGVMVILSEAVRPQRRLRVAIAGMVLMLAPAAGHQRASYLVVGAVLAAFAILFMGAAWKRRSTVTGVEVGLLASGLLGLVIAGFLVTSSPGVLIGPVEDAFAGEAEQRSAESRISLVDQAVDKIQSSPVIGSGVGTKVVRQAELSDKEVAAAAHNIVLDLTMRVGIIGLALFVGATWWTMRGGVRVWRQHPDDGVAAAAAAATIIIFGVIAKGMVEPAIDKFRLSLSLGIGVGLVMAGMRSLADAGAPDETSPARALEHG